MLKKNQRISSVLVQEVLQKGVSFHSPLFSLRIINKNGSSRFAVVVSNKVAKRANVRNSLRRLGYRALRKVFTEIKPNLIGILFFKSVPSKKGEATHNLEGELKDLLKKAEAVNSKSI